MGLYERLLAEREEEEEKEQAFPPVQEHHLLEVLVKRRPTNADTGMRLASLKKSYPASYARLKAKKIGQGSFYGRM